MFTTMTRLVILGSVPLVFFISILNIQKVMANIEEDPLRTYTFVFATSDESSDNDKNMTASSVPTANDQPELAPAKHPLEYRVDGNQFWLYPEADLSTSVKYTEYKSAITAVYKLTGYLIVQLHDGKSFRYGPRTDRPLQEVSVEEVTRRSKAPVGGVNTEDETRVRR